MGRPFSMREWWSHASASASAVGDAGAAALNDFTGIKMVVRVNRRLDRT